MRLLWISLLSLLLGAPSAAWSQAYPARPVKVIVPFGAGTGTDVAVRVVLNQVQAETGANFVVENVPGANALIGVKRALAAPADGYTLVATGTTTNSIGSALFKEANYDPIADFTHLAVVAVYPTLLVVDAKSPYRTVNDLVRASKASPGKLTWAYASASMQIKGGSFQASTGTRLTPIPYKTSTEALKDLLGGQTDCMVVDVATALSLLRGGQARALTVLGPQRSQLLPDVPTVGEAGYPRLLLDSWSGIGAPAKIPADARTWLMKHIGQAMAHRSVREKMASLGSEPVPDTPIDQWVGVQLTSWRQGARDAGMRAE